MLLKLLMLGFAYTGLVHASLLQNIIKSTELDFVFNITKFLECASINRTDLKIWIDRSGEYIITPTENFANFDFDRWLQGIGDVVSVSDGTYVVDWEEANINESEQERFSWTGKRFYVDPESPNHEKRLNCSSVVIYDVFSSRIRYLQSFKF